MRRSLSVLMPSHAMAFALAVLLGAGGGLALAATASKPALIRACANKKTGALRLAGKCRRSERSINWNQEGPRGLTGASGKEGLPGKEGPQGKEGPKGDTGQSALTPLQSGQTEHGVIGMASAVGTAKEPTTSIEAAFATLPIPAPVALDNVHVLVAGKTDKGACTGSYASPTSPAGFVCIYLDFELGAKNPLGFVPDGQATPYGFGLFWEGTNSGGDTFLEGDWAYTAP